MDIAILTLAASAANAGAEAPSQPDNADKSGFEEVLQAAQAPPGPEPPPVPQPTSGEKEQQTPEPNAQSIQPDLSSNAKQDSSSKSKKPVTAIPNVAATPNQIPSGLIASTAQASEATPGPKVTKQAASTDKAPVQGSSPLRAVLPNAEKDSTVSLKELPTDSSSQIVSAKAGADATPAVQTATPQTDPQVSALQAPEATVTTAQTGSPVTTIPQPEQTVSSAPQTAVLALNATADGAAGLVCESSTTNSGGSSSSGQPGASSTTPAQHVIDPLGAAKAVASQMGTGTGSGNPNTNAQDSGSSLKQGLPAQNLAVAKQISAHNDSMALARSASNVTVHLQSDDDTNVTLMVKSGHGEVQAQIVTNNESLKNALHQNQSQLTHKFESKGMNLGQVSVGLKQSGGRQQQSPRQSLAKRIGIVNVSSVAPASTGSFVPTNQGVDLTI